jgi:hypothetical protein
MLKYWHGKYLVSHQEGQSIIVAARSRKEAAKLFGISDHKASRYLEPIAPSAKLRRSRSVPKDVGYQLVYDERLFELVEAGDKEKSLLKGEK